MGGQLKSLALSRQYTEVAALAGAAFFDAGTVTHKDGMDGVHLTAEAHLRLGKALAAEAIRILAEK